MQSPISDICMYSDIDECLESPCAQNAVCNNTKGSYLCNCEKGFTGDGIQVCSDVDECITGDDECVENADCSNTNGDHRCVCSDGFVGDGKKQCNGIVLNA